MCIRDSCSTVTATIKTTKHVCTSYMRCLSMSVAVYARRALAPQHANCVRDMRPVKRCVCDAYILMDAIVITKISCRPTAAIHHGKNKFEL